MKPETRLKVRVFLWHNFLSLFYGAVMGLFLWFVYSLTVGIGASIIIYLLFILFGDKEHTKELLISADGMKALKKAYKERKP